MEKRDLVRRGVGAAGIVGVMWATLAAGCGGGQTRGSPFDPRWSDPDGERTHAFEAHLAKLHAPAGVDLALGITGPKELSGLTLVDGGRWRFRHGLEDRPSIAGTVVVGMGDGELFALDAVSGKLLWTLPAEGRLRGIGDDGATTVVSLEPLYGLASRVLALRRDGSVVRQIEDKAPIGVPAVAGPTALLPSSRGFLSAYDLSSGDEIARLTLRAPVSRAFAQDGAFFAGERGFTRVDQPSATIGLPRPSIDVFAGLAWTSPGTESRPVHADLWDSVRIYARPTASGELRVDGGRFVATYGRAAFGFDASSGALAWAFLNDAAFIGGAAARAGFVLCDAQGAAIVLDEATGREAMRISIGERVEACVVQTDAFFTIAPPPRAPEAPPSLHDQVERVLQAADQELLPLQRSLRAMHL